MDNGKLVELLELAKGEDRSLNTFAQHANVSAGNLSRVFNGQKPSPQLLKKIASRAYNGVTYEQLMEAAGYLSNAESQYNTIPILGTIRAGLPLLAEDNWESTIEISNEIKADFALRVVGDSMSWVGIHEGDLALLQKTNVAQNGQIVAAGIENATWEATLKFYMSTNSHYVLRAANPGYPDMLFTEKHRIIGVVVNIIKEPPSIFTYRDFLTSKEMHDDDWLNTVETAAQYGLEPKDVASLIEMFSKLKK